MIRLVMLPQKIMGGEELIHLTIMSQGRTLLAAGQMLMILYILTLQLLNFMAMELLVTLANLYQVYTLRLEISILE